MLKYLAVAKILKKRRPSVDNFVLHLHYRITFLIFFIASSFVMAKEYFGKPIACLTKNTIPARVLEIYCFIQSTFSVPRHYDKPLGMGVSFHGLGNQYLNGKEDDIVYHSYYQWVPLVLFMQAMIFYMPRYFWKSAEGGLFDVVLSGLNDPQTNVEARKKKYQVLSKYMIQNLNLHTAYAWSFFFCEGLAFVIVVGNIFFINFFLGGTFLNYGSDVVNLIEMDDFNRTDPMVKIFPTVTKCNFRSFGSSGSIETHDTMCVLALNIFNQKVYILLWFWLIILAVITGLWVLYRIATILFPVLRLQLLKARAQMSGHESLSQIERRCSLGDWFLLHQLGRVLEPTVFADFLRELTRTMDNMPPSEEAYPMLPIDPIK